MSASLAQEIAEKLLESMGIAAIVEVESQEPVYLHINSDDSALLIGKRGESLRALENLINNLYRQSELAEGYVGIDIAGYKKERLEKVQALAQETADKVISSGLAHHLNPMNSFERRAVHTLLAETPELITESEGEGPTRHIVIKPR